FLYFFFQAEDGIRDPLVTGVQTCALPIFTRLGSPEHLTQERSVSFQHSLEFRPHPICRTLASTQHAGLRLAIVPDQGPIVRARILHGDHPRPMNHLRGSCNPDLESRVPKSSWGR